MLSPGIRFVVQPFILEAGQFKAVEAISAKSAPEATECARIINWRYSGVVAYSSAAGALEIIAKFGVLPLDFCK